MGKKDKGGAVVMTAVAVAVVQAAAKPVAVGLDTSNRDQAGQATNDRVGKHTPMRT